MKSTIEISTYAHIYCGLLLKKKGKYKYHYRKAEQKNYC